MTKTLTRAGLVALAVAASVLNGSPLAVPVLGFAALALFRLVEYGMAETEKALDVASARRVAELTWELRTQVAGMELERRRRRAAHAAPQHAAPLVHARAYDGLCTPPGGLPLLCGYAA
jgi:hypothetical protein